VEIKPGAWDRFEKAVEVVVRFGANQRGRRNDGWQ
jgi:hypothetical protein